MHLESTASPFDLRERTHARARTRSGNLESQQCDLHGSWPMNIHAAGCSCQSEEQGMALMFIHDGASLLPCTGALCALKNRLIEEAKANQYLHLFLDHHILFNT